ncbi:MAG: ATP-binding cassette domain-containing protein [Candidatus Lokiarchaeota archaeon]|nr:ATP-binding cassette domain-containing protein [Candidatus Lokiarchaeota archaeon]
MIEIKNLTKQFKDIKAVDNVSLKIEEGEIFGLLGPNGAGKSTLIHLLSTVIKPDSGTALINGYDLIKNPFKVRKSMSISFQDPKLDWQLNLTETLNWHGRVWRVPATELNIRINEIVKVLKLQDLTKKKNWKLSGGTRKKVEVARTLIVRPKIAVFDEPTAFLDPNMKEIIWNYIRELRKEGSTIILATNLMHEADILSDRVAIMDKGKIITIDTPEALKASIPGGDVIYINVNNKSGIIELDPIINELKKEDTIKDVLINELKSPNEIEIKILLNNAKKMTSTILKLFQENGVIIKNFEMTNPNLDDVFFYYTKSTLKT